MINPTLDPEKANILILDDNRVSLQFLAKILSEEGYSVHPTLDGETALIDAQTNPPDLVLLDINMPKMNGYEVCQRLKADRRTRDIPVIFISGLNEVLDKIKGFNVGGVDYLTKPFEPEEVSARIKTHLSLQMLRQQLEVQNERLDQEISERKQAQATLQAAYDTLDQQVKMRTAELAHTNEALRAEIIEHQVIAEVLRQREQQLESFFSQSLDGFFFMMLDEPVCWNETVDKENVLDYVFQHQRMTKINEAMLAQYGATKEQFLGLTPQNLFEFDIHYGRAVWHELFNQGRYQMKTQEQKFDGTPMWVEGEYVCLYDKEGRITGHFGIQREVTAQKQAEHQVKASLQEKEVLLKEIHHRVKNNMQVISSLLDLQADRIADPTVRGLFRESQQRVKSMGLVHESLYRSHDLARINFAEYVKNLTDNLSQSYDSGAGNVTVHLDIEPLPLTIETAIPCGLIINELVTNAFKHAFPGNQTGDIWIELKVQENQQFRLVVTDNGKGIPPEIDFGRTTSLGLTLVNALVGQLQGVITLNVEGKTSFEMILTELSSQVDE